MKTHTAHLGDLTMVFECEPCEGKYLDTKVTVNGVQMCWISWPEKDEFIQKLTNIIDTFRI